MADKKKISIEMTSGFKLENALLVEIKQLTSKRKQELIHGCLIYGYDFWQKNGCMFSPKLLDVNQASNENFSEQIHVYFFQKSPVDSLILKQYSLQIRSRRGEFLRNCILMGFLLTKKECNDLDLVQPVSNDFDKKTNEIASSLIEVDPESKTQASKPLLAENSNIKNGNSENEGKKKMINNLIS